jgi:hypothetical protein
MRMMRLRKLLVAIGLVLMALTALLFTAAVLPAAEEPPASFTLDGWESGGFVISGGDPDVLPSSAGWPGGPTVDQTLRAAPLVPAGGVIPAAKLSTPVAPRPDPFGVIQAVDGGPTAVVDTLGLKIGFLSASTAKYVDLSWQRASPEMVFTIRRDDEIIGRTTSTSFRDTSVEPGQDYYYLISADPVQDPAGDDASTVPTVFGIPVYTPSDDTATAREELLTRINGAESSVAKTSQAAAPAEDGRLSLRAFIPSRYYEPPLSALS